MEQLQQVRNAASIIRTRNRRSSIVVTDTQTQTMSRPVNMENINKVDPLVAGAVATVGALHLTETPRPLLMQLRGRTGAERTILHIRDLRQTTGRTSATIKLPSRVQSHHTRVLQEKREMVIRLVPSM